MFEDDSGTIAFNHAGISYNSANRDIQIDRVTPFPMATFYLYLKTISGLSSAVRVKVEVCGAETIVLGAGYES